MRIEDKRRRRLVLENQTRRLGRRLVVLRRRSRRLSHLRLGLFLLGAVISAATLLSAGVWQWLGVSLGVAAPFFTAVHAHRRVEESIRCYEIWLDFKETHIARMDLVWERMPAALPVPPRLDHPFALDLDLIGERSIHRLLDTAVSHEGSLLLRDWLLEEEPDLDRMLDRQALVKELVPRPVFRDKLRLYATLAAGASAGNSPEKWPGQRLLDWLSGQTDWPDLQPVIWLLVPLSLVNLTLGALAAAGILPAWWVATWVLYAAVSAVQVRRIGPVFHEAFFLRDGLEQLGAVFDFLERNRYGRALRLRELCTPFVREGKRPSQHLKRVRRVVAAISLQKNPILWFWLNALIPWDIYFARNPDNIFPTVTAEKTTLFQAKGLGHPLIPDDSRIGNDFTIRQAGTVDIITGSNMSGKSSFLRTMDFLTFTLRCSDWGRYWKR